MDRVEKVKIEDREYLHHGAGSGSGNDKIAKLLLKSVELFPVVNTLLVECGTGILAGEFHTHGCTVSTFNSNYINYLYSQKNCPGTHLYGDLMQETIESTYRQILFRITKSAQYNYSAVNKLLNVLQENGHLYIAGGNKEGIKSVEKRLSQAGIATTMFANGGGGRILQVAQTTNRVEEEYAICETPYTFDGTELLVKTIPGLFSYGKSDKGTQLLLKHIPGITGKKVLDLGCGSGILSLAALERGAASVMATDIHATALAATRINVQDERCEIQPSYIAEGLEQKFDIVITNPPFHEGQKSNFSIGEEWLRRIRKVIDKRSVVYLVANNFLPYITMGTKVFEKVERIAEENGFSVYKMSGVIYE